MRQRRAARCGRRPAHLRTRRLQARLRDSSHHEEAIWTPALTRAAGLGDDKGRALWNRLGRKVDPIGRRKDGRPIIDIAQVRLAVADALGGERGGNDDALL